MTYRRLHLQLSTHGSPTSLETVSYACALAKEFGAVLRAASPVLDVRPPSHWLAGQMLKGFAAELEQKAEGERQRIEAELRRCAGATGVDLTICPSPEVWPRHDYDVASGRTADLCVLGLAREDLEQRMEVEAWLFGAGRPCLLHPADSVGHFSLNTVAIAWDESRTAARAVSDAIPLLGHARAVRILTVRGEKSIPSKDPGSTLVEYLALHGITATAEEFAIGSHGIGRALLEGAGRAQADLLVMGAYGHSRLQEFLLGGATRDVLSAASMPLLLSN